MNTRVMDNNRELKKRGSLNTRAVTNLVCWLNDEQDKTFGRNTKISRDRILDLLATFKDTLQAIETAPADVDLLGRPPRKLSRLLAELDARLAEYRTCPIAYVECDRSLVVDYAVAEGRCPGESVAAYGVIHLARLQRLNRLRRCVCEKYFFANFGHQKSCSAVCRHRKYEQTEQFKSARREYMRNYYRLKNSGKVK